MSKGDQKAYLAAVSKHRDLILDGWLMCIDQATGLGDSDPGYAVYHKGELQESGVLSITTKHLPEALRQIQEQLVQKSLAECDFLVIEAHRGRLVHPHLHYSSGAVLAAVDCWAWTKIPVQQWKKVSRMDTTYSKSDENDAKIFGETVLADARAAREAPPRVRTKRKKRRTRSK